MIKIKIDLVPFGFLPIENSWLAKIANNGSGTLSSGNYNFKIYQKNSSTKIWKEGHVSGFNRQQKSVWYLLYLCLKQIYEE